MLQDYRRQLAKISFRSFIFNMETSFKAKSMPTKQALHLKKQLKNACLVDIICHSSTDEDAIASAKAMEWYIKKLKVPCRVIQDRAEDTFEYNKIATNDLSQNNYLDSSLGGDTILCIDFSSYSRINPNLHETIKTIPQLICLDHHTQGDLNSQNPNIYIDTTAKSCAGVIMRFFESLNINPPNIIKKHLFCGMTDDLRKNGYIKYNESTTPIPTKLIENDTNTQSLYNRLRNELSQDDKDTVIKHLNKLASLTQEEKAFKDSLPSRAKYIANGKFAYIEIPVNDKEWQALGGDNSTTSAIIGDFRKTTLEENPTLDSVAVFYPNHNGYRISIHSQNNNVLNLFNYIKSTTIPDFIGGGHEERGGGTNLNFNPEKCRNWVDNILIATEDFFK